jgi:hypothetical protein
VALEVLLGRLLLEPERLAVGGIPVWAVADRPLALVLALLAALLFQLEPAALCPRLVLPAFLVSVLFIPIAVVLVLAAVLLLVVAVSPRLSFLSLFLDFRLAFLALALASASSAAIAPPANAAPTPTSPRSGWSRVSRPAAIRRTRSSNRSPSMR